MEPVIDHRGQDASGAAGTDFDPEDVHPLFRTAPDGLAFKKVRKRLVGETRRAITDFAMANRGDKWLVCLSGGKDSYTLLAVLLELKWRGLLPVDLLAANLDQGQPGFPKHVLPEYLSAHGIDHHIAFQDTYSVVVDTAPENRTYCALCSRMRRGALYRIAREQGCNAIVLGHHREDILETFFLNLFHGAKLAAMPPKLRNEEGDLMLYRPLAYCAEADIRKYADLMRFPIIPCDLCGSQDGLQRQQVKAMLDEWEIAHPGRKQVMLKALTRVHPSHLLDRSLFDFAGLDINPPVADQPCARS